MAVSVDVADQAEKKLLSERHIRMEKEKHKAELERLAEEEDKWVFDCAVCGLHGENLDDGSHLISCEKCGVWQHSKCHHITPKQAEKEDFHFVCSGCQSTDLSHTPATQGSSRSASERPSKPGNTNVEAASHEADIERERRVDETEAEYLHLQAEAAQRKEKFKHNKLLQKIRKEVSTRNAARMAELDKEVHELEEQQEVIHHAEEVREKELNELNEQAEDDVKTLRKFDDYRELRTD